MKNSTTTKFFLLTILLSWGAWGRDSDGAVTLSTGYKLAKEGHLEACPWASYGRWRCLGAMLLLHWVSTTASSIFPTTQGETIGLVIVSPLILLSWRRRPAQEMIPTEASPR